MGANNKIFIEHKFLYYSEQNQTRLNVSVFKENEEVNFFIYDKFRRIELVKQDIPGLIKILKQALSLSKNL